VSEKLAVNPVISRCRVERKNRRGRQWVRFIWLMMRVSNGSLFVCHKSKRAKKRKLITE
jgi:hypothetical protein